MHFLLIDPAGLKADESLALRKEVTEAGGQLRQAKARVIRKAVPEDARRNHSKWW